MRGEIIQHPDNSGVPDLFQMKNGHACAVEYALCGGLAMAIYALPRATLDIDILIEAVSLDAARSSGHDRGVLSMKIDMSPGAVTLRLRQVAQLRQAVLVLARSSRGTQILRKNIRSVQRTALALGRRPCRVASWESALIGQ